MPEIKDIESDQEIDELRALLDEQEADDLASGSDLGGDGSDMTFDCD